MLKSKKWIYVLIALNIYGWGSLINHFYKLLKSDSSNGESGVQISQPKKKKQEKEKYVLKLNYEDPFLKGNTKGGAVSKNYAELAPEKPKREANVIQQSSSKEKAVKAVPSIQYLGLVKNKVSGFSTALILVNGQSKLVKPNDVIDGMLFKNFNRDSLVAKWGKEQIVVKR